MTWKMTSPKVQLHGPDPQPSPLWPRARNRTTGKQVRRCRIKEGLWVFPPRVHTHKKKSKHPTPVSALPKIQPGLEAKVACSRRLVAGQSDKARRFATNKGGFTEGGDRDGKRFRHWKKGGQRFRPDKQNRTP